MTWLLTAYTRALVRFFGWLAPEVDWDEIFTEEDI
jgi:hypothetical protein